VLALPPQHGPDSSQELPQAERFGYTVDGAALESDHPVDLVASVAGNKDHRGVAARADLAQQVEPIDLAEAQTENYQVRLAFGDLTHNLLPPASRDGPHVVIIEIVNDHLPHGEIVDHDKDVHRATTFAAHHPVWTRSIAAFSAQNCSGGGARSKVPRLRSSRAVLLSTSERRDGSSMNLGRLSSTAAPTG
jgi:hypothetical protein